MNNILTSIKVGLVGVVTVIGGWFGLVPESQMTPLPPQSAQEEVVVGAYGITGGGTYRLKASVGSSDTTINLSSFKEPVSEIAYTMSYLNTTIAYGTIDPQTTRPEFISFTGITQNSDGSAALTGVTRGLTRTPQASSCTASTTLAVRHPGQAIFILSDSPCHFAEYAVKKNDETITGLWNTPTPLSNTNIANKLYVDTIATGGTVTNDAIVVAGTAGETIATGTIIYFNRFEAEWRKADADMASTTHNILIGIAQGSGTDGVTIQDGILLTGRDTNQGGSLTDGQRLYLSGTAGATSTSAGTYRRLLGVVKDTNEFYFDPTMLEEEGQFIHASTTTFLATNSTTTNATTTNFSTTNISLNNISYTFPASQTASSTVLGTNGSASLSWIYPPQLIADGTTYSTTANSTTTVFTYRLPAGTLTPTGGLKIEAIGYSDITGGNGAAWSMQLGTGSASTTIARDGFNQDSSYQRDIMTVWIYNNNSVSSQVTSFIAVDGNATMTASSTPSAYNTAADTFISFRAQNVANTGEAIGYKGISIIRLGQ